MFTEELEKSQCQHEFKKNVQLCLHCGIYQHQNKAVKSNKFVTNAHCSHTKYLKHMHRR